MTFGYPEQYGYAPNGHCAHCNSLDWAVSDWGAFCLACCRWIVYTGPPQEWGDGMKTTDPDLQEQGATQPGESGSV